LWVEEEGEKMSSLTTTVELFDANFLFSPSEETSDSLGAVFSTNISGNSNLLTEFGNTGEIENGFMFVTDIPDWVNRYSKKYSLINPNTPVKSPDPFGTEIFNGATGILAAHWWSVHNFLQYGGSCIIAGDVSGNVNHTIQTTPILDKSTIPNIDVVFALDGGSFQADSVYKIVAGRNFDCFGVVGAGGTMFGGYGEPINGVGGQSAGNIFPLGLSLGRYGMSIYGEKEHFGLADEELTVISSPLIPDAAGCLIRTDRDFYPWYAPAGYVRGRILNSIRLRDQPSENSQKALNEKMVNFAITVPGQGTFMLSNKTLLNDAVSPYRYINVSRLLVYLIKNINPIAKRYLFEVNDDISRESFVTNVSTILEQVKTTGGVLEYFVVCDSTNNTPDIIEEGKFIADIIIQPVNSVQSVTIRFTNISN
jgi:hypothetical protein